MSLLLTGAQLAAAVNVLLLSTLLAVWVRTYREVRAPLTLGSIVFAAFLLAENLVALWFYLTAPAMPVVAVEVMMALQMLETIGIAVFTSVTLR